MNGYSQSKGEIVECPDVDSFINDIIEVYKKHGLAISHEDRHGNFEIVEFVGEGDRDVEWLKEASDARTPAHGPTISNNKWELSEKRRLVSDGSFGGVFVFESTHPITSFDVNKIAYLDSDGRISLNRREGAVAEGKIVRVLSCGRVHFSAILPAGCEIPTF